MADDTPLEELRDKAEPNRPRDELILFRDGESVRLLAYKYDVLAKSSMDGVNWMDSALARGAMFDPGTDAVPITVEEARKLHPNLVLPDQIPDPPAGEPAKKGPAVDRPSP